MAAAAVSGEVVSSNANGLNPGPVSNNAVNNGNTGYNTNTGGGFVSTPFAEARHAGDTYGSPSAPIVDSYSSPPSNVWPEAANAYPYSFAPSNPSNGGGLGFSANADVGFPGQGFLNTALTIVFALVGFSLLIQLITKIMAAPFIADLFEGRSLSPDNIIDYTNMAMNGIQKMQEIYEQLE